MEENKIDPITEYRNKLKCTYPELFSKIKTLEDMNYLNPIDKSFYIIRLRENFYQLNKTIIGEEYEKNEGQSVEYKIIRGNYSKRADEDTWEDFIKNIDNILITKISKNLGKIKINYDLLDLEWALSKPNPVLLDKPNLLAISPFLFSLKEWIKIIENDISKIYGKPLERDNMAKRFNNIEASIYNKKRVTSLPEEIEERIGTSQIKDYKQKSSFVYIKSTTMDFIRLVLKIRFQKDIGTQNENILAKEVKLIDKIKLKEKIQFKISSKQIRKIYSYFFKNFLNIDNQAFDKEVIYYANFFDNSQDTKIKHLDFPKFSFLTEDNWKDYFILIKFLKEKNSLKIKYKDFAYFLNNTTTLKVTNSQAEKVYKKVNINKDLYRSLNSELCK